jgi:prepilin-type N-terminal cleavage/methylation domain-containing protein
MKTNRPGIRGVTLVELLIVIAILTILGAVAVPSLARMGAFTRDDISHRSRTVSSLLLAARSYAALFRTDTAVLYMLNTTPDSREQSVTQTIADGVGMARRLSPEEFNYFANAPDGFAALGYDGGDLTTLQNRAFALVENRAGRLREIEGGACIWAQVDADLKDSGEPDADEDLEKQLLWPEPTGFGDYVSAQGLYPIILFRIEEGTDGMPEIAGGQEITPRIAIPDFIDGIAESNVAHSVDGTWPFFPAHVFKPSGEVRAPDEVGAVRLDVLVGARPDLSLNDRFLDYAETDLEDVPDDPDAVDVPVPGVIIKLNKFTGKVQTFDEKGPA